MAEVAATSRLAQGLARRSELFKPGMRQRIMTASKGMDGVIALARGDPDFDTPPNVVAAANRALDEGWTHYTPWTGLPDLRSAIAAKLERDNGITANPDTEIAVTGGAQAGLFVAMQMLVDPGDDVLLPDPHYSAYDGAIAIAGGTSVLVPSRSEYRFEVEVSELESRVTPQAKLLVLVDPSNPAGAVLDAHQVREIADFVIRHDLVVLADEVYEKLVFDGRTHTSIASLPEMRERTVSIFSFSKSYAMTGWRIGYMVAPADFIDRAGELHYNMSISASTPAQVAAIEALTGAQDHMAAMVASFAKRRDFVAAAFEEMDLPCVPPHGGFTVMVDIRSTGQTSMDFFQYLLREAAVQVMPGSFYGPSAEGFVRVSVLAPEAQLAEAMRRIGDAVSRVDRAHRHHL